MIITPNSLHSSRLIPPYQIIIIVAKRSASFIFEAWNCFENCFRIHIPDLDSVTNSDFEVNVAMMTGNEPGCKVGKGAGHSEPVRNIKFYALF